MWVKFCVLIKFVTWPKLVFRLGRSHQVFFRISRKKTKVSFSEMKPSFLRRRKNSFLHEMSRANAQL